MGQNNDGEKGRGLSVFLFHFRQCMVSVSILYVLNRLYMNCVVFMQLWIIRVNYYQQVILNCFPQ